GVGATEGAKRRYTEVAAEAYARPFRVEVCSRAKRWRNRRYSQMAFCGDVRPGGAAALGDQYFSRREPLQLRKQRVGQAVALPMSAAKGAAVHLNIGQAHSHHGTHTALLWPACDSHEVVVPGRRHHA